MRVLLLSLLFLCVACSPEGSVDSPLDPRMPPVVDGEVTIQYHPGGFINNIWQTFMDFDSRSIMVRVTGGCYSACTMAIAEQLRLNCTTWTGSYHFHGAAIRTFGRVIEVDDRTTVMWHVYPKEVQDALPPPEEWVSTKWNVLSSRELNAVQGRKYRSC